MIKKKAGIGLLLLLTAGYLCGCRNDKSTAALFEKHYPENLNKCINAAVREGVEKTVAERMCACMLVNLYLIDSTFVLKQGDELNELINRNMDTLAKLCNKEEEKF